MVDVLVVVGGDAADGLSEGALAGGMAPERVHRHADSRAAADFVTGAVEPGDLVLVKGSRGIRTDVIADRLKEVA
jgi:UDP-N-acetylmuramoyl-tripeptide--D-alanyl-D-alanine ligase